MTATDLKQFHDDLAAAVVSGVPLSMGSNQSFDANRLTLKKLTRLREQTDQSEELPARYLAAEKTFARSNSMAPVLDGLTVRDSAQLQLQRVLRWSLGYLMILLLVACLGLAFFRESIVPSFALMRADILLPAAANAPHRFDFLEWLPALILGTGGLFIVLLIWMLLGGTLPIAGWLGGRHYLRCRILSTSLRTLATLLAGGMEFKEAVKTSCDLTAACESTQADLRATAGPNSDQHSLYALAEHYSALAQRHLSALKLTLPMVLVSLVGGGVTLLYCLAIYGPLVSMIKDLTTLGT